MTEDNHRVSEKIIMRMPKYRAWHKTSKKMFDVLCIDLDAEFGGVWKWGKAYHDHDTGEHEADKDFIVHDQIELMQFTGLQDKHGKDIYEGDILKADWRDVRYPVHTIGPVKWDDENARWDVGEGGNPKVDAQYNYEIIGNIYEHPDLMEGDPHA